MNHILIIAHAPLASALRTAALHVFPHAAKRLWALDVPAHEPPETTLQACKGLLQQAQATASMTATLVLSDVLGATPCNVAQKLVDGVQTQCLAGASLPMLLRAITYWDDALDALAGKAMAGGSQGTVQVPQIAHAASA